MNRKVNQEGGEEGTGQTDTHIKLNLERILPFFYNSGTSQGRGSLHKGAVSRDFLPLLLNSSANIFSFLQKTCVPVVVDTVPLIKRFSAYNSTEIFLKMSFASKCPISVLLIKELDLLFKKKPLFPTPRCYTSETMIFMMQKVWKARTVAKFVYSLFIRGPYMVVDILFV